MDKQQLRDAYKLYWLENGKPPVSVYAFCKIVNVPEAEFYDSYSSLETLEKDVWLGIFQETVDQLKADEIYQNYSAREKLLTFYFMWVQKLKADRSYILLQKEKFGFPVLHQGQLDSFRKAFYKYAEDLIKEGYQTNEIKERKYISDQYVHGFWVQALFVLRYWIDDTSDKFEMTDAAIEKAVQLSFQLIGANSIDGLLDLGKFMFTGK